MTKWEYSMDKVKELARVSTQIAIFDENRD